MSSDFARRHQGVSDKIKRLLVLTDIEKRLQIQEKELSDFGLPTPSKEERKELALFLNDETPKKISLLIQDALDFEVDTVTAECEKRVIRLNQDQLAVYEYAMKQQEEG